MKTKIIHYGNDSEIYSPYMATCDSDDAAKCVYKKKEMLEFVRIVTEHFLTPRQRYFYFQCVVYGKRVEDIAALEGVDDSTVYKHLKLAKRKIANLKEVMQISGGRKGTIVLFQQAVQALSDDCQAVMIDKYVNCLSISAIVKKEGMTYGRVRNILSSTRNRLKRCGVEKDDLDVVRDYFKKQKAKEREYGPNSN